MNFHALRLKRPYDYRVLIEAYAHTKRDLFPEFQEYYASLVDALQKPFGVRMSHEGAGTMSGKVLWMLFNATVRSLNQITHPWAGFIEDTLLTRKVEENSDLCQVVDQARNVILGANQASEAAHRELLYALFRAIFGERRQIVTSEELLAAGFDDSKEPDIAEFYDHW